nr:hypothetical protein [uncultured Lichenicoccus sp.]
MPHSILEPWYDFYLLIGTGAATLVGLMFVAASVGSDVFTHERQHALRIFLSPTVVAFSFILAASLVGVMPAATCEPAGLLLAGFGLLGVAYSGLIWSRMVRHGIARSIDLEDRAWYAVIPAVAYILLTAAGVTLCLGNGPACALLASGMCLLLLAGIRNAWDMTTWVVLHRGSRVAAARDAAPKLEP